ncbi:MAG TPA: hypothetical protein VKR21_02305 [Solirubrobacteraceae bacterium]|nr:hypothetical protein [Solirubrobacteraceae bacterium]
MTERDETTNERVEAQANDETRGGAVGQRPPGGDHQPSSERPTADDRRGSVKPTDNPVPSSPAADEQAVREGEEKLERVKPY